MRATRLPGASVPKDVADGYSALLPLYHGRLRRSRPPRPTVRPEALAAAQKALQPMPSRPVRPARRSTVLAGCRHCRADSAQQRTWPAFNAASQGPIYQAGVAEWMAKAAVTKSVADYNTQVT